MKLKINRRQSKICCVIKADGYGHGAVELAHIYEKPRCRLFAVSNIDEGVEIRNSGCTLPKVILGYTPVTEAVRLSQYKSRRLFFHLNMQSRFQASVQSKTVSAKFT
jgi:alanine racemase